MVVVVVEWGDVEGEGGTSLCPTVVIGSCTCYVYNHSSIHLAEIQTFICFFCLVHSPMTYDCYTC